MSSVICFRFCENSELLQLASGEETNMFEHQRVEITIARVNCRFLIGDNFPKKINLIQTNIFVKSRGYSFDLWIIMFDTLTSR